jgi:hypothetical protein
MSHAVGSTWYPLRVDGGDNHSATAAAAAAEHSAVNGLELFCFCGGVLHLAKSASNWDCSGDGDEEGVVLDAGGGSNMAAASSLECVTASHKICVLQTVGILFSPFLSIFFFDRKAVCSFLVSCIM